MYLQQQIKALDFASRALIELCSNESSQCACAAELLQQGAADAMVLLCNESTSQTVVQRACKAVSCLATAACSPYYTARESSVGVLLCYW
jgi:hypothetical protein